MTNPSQAPTHQAINPSRGSISIYDVLIKTDVMSKILQDLSVGEIIQRKAASRVWNEASKDALKKIKQFLDTLEMLKDDKVISEELFSEITKDTFLKSRNPIWYETFLNSSTQFKEIATKINTQIETLQNTNPEITIDKLNNLKNKFLEYLILKPQIIETIKPDKIGLQQKSNFCYLGEIKNEKANGYGTETYENGATYVGEFNNDKPHGYGTFTWSDGKRYEGEYKDGKRDGHGTHTNKKGDSYDGKWQNDMLHGRGTFTWSDGNRYEGEYKDGNRHGQGIFTSPNGDRYVGEFQDGKYHGRGTFTSPNGDRYEGEWVNGQPNGQGKETLSNGDIFEGEWLDGHRHGWGKEIFCHGTYLGGFREGKRDGYGKLTFVNGNVYEGLWRNGYGVNVVLIGKVINPQDAKGLRRRGPALQGCKLKRPKKLSTMELREFNLELDSKDNRIIKQKWMSIADIANIFLNPKINREKEKWE